jgi:hypothetical protein
LRCYLGSLISVVPVGLVLARLIGRPRRLSVAHSCARRRRRRLIGILRRALIGAWTLARILAGALVRALIRSLVRILRRIIRRGDLSILGVGWRPCLTPITLLARGRSLLVGGPALLLRHQSRSQREACAERPGKQPWQTICSDEIHFFVTPLPKLDARSPARAYCIHRRRFPQSVTGINPGARQKLRLPLRQDHRVKVITSETNGDIHLSFLHNFWSTGIPFSRVFVVDMLPCLPPQKITCT